jgi:hypothetical protein
MSISWKIVPLIIHSSRPGIVKENLMEPCLENNKPKILVLATLSGGYAGANAVGQQHTDYPSNTYVLPVMCPSMFPPDFYLRSFEHGIDGIVPSKVVPSVPPNSSIKPIP